MEPRPLSYIAAACGGQFRGDPAVMASRISTDSRTVQPGDVFFALAGERFDGHDYLRDVAGKGAVAVVLERRRATGEGLPCSEVLVEDTRKALGALAARYRSEFDPALIAVGGSNGKTSTKELIASVLRQKLATIASEGSFNNDIGVPHTLLRLRKDHRAAVLEVGTNHPGELEPLVRMAAPQSGVITCIGREHLEFFGDLQGVAIEEGRLGELLPASGTLYLNGDDENSSTLPTRTAARVTRVGLGAHNLWRACSLRLDRDGVSFRLAAPESRFAGEYRINLLGRHQVTNALFAVAIGAALGLSREEIAKGLAECRPAKMRLQLWEYKGIRVLDDAYNANADSMVVALRTLQELPCRGRRVAVLGDMAELGVHSEAAHEEVGRRAAELGVGQLFAVGKMAPVIARAARNAGLNRVLEFSDVEAAAAAVRQFLRSGDLLLLKASRAARLERLSELLRREEAAGKN